MTTAPIPREAALGVDAGPGDATCVDIARWRRQERFLGALLPTALGASGVVAAAVGATVPPSTGIRVVTGVLGLLLLVLGGALFGWLVARPPRAELEVGAQALSVRDRDGTVWQLPWPDVTGLHIARTPARTQVYRTGAAPSVYVFLARRYLVIDLRHGATRPARLPVVSGGRQGVIDLGVPPATARSVARVLGARLTDPATQRLDADRSRRIRAAAEGRGRASRG